MLAQFKQSLSIPISRSLTTYTEHYLTILGIQYRQAIDLKGTSLASQWWRIYLLVQETWVQSLDQKDPLKKEMATHSSILAWEILWTEESGGLPSIGLQKSWTWLSDEIKIMDLKRDLDPKLTRSVFDLNIAKVQITPPPQKKSPLFISQLPW